MFAAARHAPIANDDLCRPEWGPGEACWRLERSYARRYLFVKYGKADHIDCPGRRPLKSVDSPQQHPSRCRLQAIFRSL